ncbi:ABC transporter permease [Halostella pelagica]|uniref:ABC transporter permease n=1 Tax=Halostella pelagica TaxID=2583824 RepID=UPI00192A177A|nr:ABC transporter permease [Halostella pelagica]
MIRPLRAVQRLRAMAGVAGAWIRHDPARTTLAVVGIALAVLAATVLAGVGVGVLATAETKFDAADRDLWVTGGPVRFDPGTVGGIENTVVDAHEVADGIESRDGVETAVPMAFQSVYVSPNGSDFQTHVGAGAPARGPSVSIAEGNPFRNDDVHYANGSYDGPMTHELVIDRQTANRFDVTVGDTLHVGGTIETARNHEFTVVGISPTYSRFLGTPTVTMHLSELQEVTGTTASDRATFITVDVRDGAETAAVKAEIERAHPDYEVRTNEEQIRAILGERAVVLAAAASLVTLAVAGGLALTANVLSSVIYQRRRELSVLRALGWSRWTTVGTTTLWALFLGLLGSVLGVLATFPVAFGVNRLVGSIVGFDGVVRLSPRILVGGAGLGIAVSLVSGFLVAVLVSRHDPVAGADR